MAIINPTAADFKANQERTLDYQQYRSSSDILRAVSEFYKIAIFKDIAPGNLNFITSGLNTDVEVTDSKLNIEVYKGTAVLDNQAMQITEDFIFQYDKPDSDQNYYVYLYYKYVEEYPANYAFISVTTSETTDANYNLISKVAYSSSDDSATVDMSPRNALVSKYVNPDSGKLFPVNIDGDATMMPTRLYFADTSNGAITLTLPDNPSIGDTIAVFDAKNSFKDNNLTISAPDGYTINGESEYVVKESSSFIKLQITDPASDTNWYILESVIPESEISASLKPVAVDSDGDALSNKLMFVDTSNNTVTLTLPSDPAAGDVVAVFDAKSSFKSNNLTIKAPDGYTVNGESEYVFKINGTYAKLQIVDPANDTNWQIIEFTIPADDISSSLKTFVTDSDGDAVANRLMMVDTSNNTVTLTLPSGPDPDTLIEVFDMKANFDNNSLTVNAPDGYTINGGDSLEFTQKGTYAKIQLTDPANDTNWYITLADSTVIDGGTY